MRTAPRVWGAAGSYPDQERDRLNSCCAAVVQDLPPRELHDPSPDDKRALFEVAQVHRLVGTWQGPGSIAQLSQRARP
jgi:hypothetical protein